MQSTKQAVFALGDREYGFDIMDVNTIEKVIPILPVANIPANFKGIIQLRGETIPVYSLRRKFGLPDVPTDDNTRYIIAKAGGMLVAYEVDQMKEIVQLEQDQLNEFPSILKSLNTSYVKFVTNVNGRLILGLDQNKLMAQEEEAMLNRKWDS
ncbi:MAG: CheW protein [Herbinix sp.]|jgi:purine-binding chemotaxis protein CheW|nr:CheW protein [Herbinix sp.]